ncbi:MAG: polysaccharide deacetylase family protein, partial [Abitibacteriaceae bacterium]|nr:polysaccharide deacetylase family protein [Abditibacteriaceae bacterium]
LTFDDSKPSQFRIITGKDGQPHIDPNCAVGILETFHKKHPDWATKGTFFVLPKEGTNYDPFSQPETVQDKFDYLLKNGYEIANHTSTHSNMHGMKADKVKWELATALHDIKQVAPKATMDVFALPYGKLPRDEQARQSLISGSLGGTSYKHKAVLLAAWRPILSPITRADKKLSEGGTFCIYDPYRLERIKPNPQQANQPGTLEYWLRYFQKNPGQRYRSDGNTSIVTVPAAYQSQVDTARVKAYGQTLQTYGGSTGKGGGGGSSLTVE